MPELSSKSISTLRELLERLPGIVNGHTSSTPTAIQLENGDSTNATEALKAARARFLQTAQSYFKPCFQEAILDNLTRDDPFASPSFGDDISDQAKDQASRRRQMDEIIDKVRASYSEHLASTERIDQHLKHLREQVGELSREAKAATEAGIPIFDKIIGASEHDRSSDSDRECEGTLREQEEKEEKNSVAETRKADLAAQVVALRHDLGVKQDEVSVLEQGQTGAAAAATSEDAIRKADTSRDLENMFGIADMTDAQVDAAVRKERTLVRRNGDVCEWYKAIVSSCKLLTGVQASHRLLFGGADATFGGGVQGLELMVDLGSGQILQVTVSAADGKIRSAEVCSSVDDGESESRITASELAKLKTAADALPSPGNLRMLVREALCRAKYAAIRSEHVRILRRRYLVGYREAAREVTITMPVGIVVSLRLHPDYPKVAGGAEVTTIAGVGGWSASETEQLCRRVNSLALSTIMETMSGLEEAVAAFDG